MSSDQQGLAPVIRIVTEGSETFTSTPLASLDTLRPPYAPENPTLGGYAVSEPLPIGAPRGSGFEAEVQAVPDRMPVIRAPLSQGTDTMVVLSTWRMWLEANYSPATCKHYWGTVNRLFARHPLPIEHITEDHLADFINQYPHRAAARRASYQAFKNLFTWARRHDIIDRNPVEGILVPKVQERVPRALSESEFEAVLRCAYAHHKMRGATIRVLYYTACRLGELVTIRWADIEDDKLILRGHKSGKDRIVDMTPGLREALSELWDLFGGQEFIIPRSGETIWEWCRKAGKDAGIERVHPHLFRSTAATRMLVRGAKVHAVSRALGHAGIATTQVYLAVTDEDRQEAFSAL